MEEDNLKINEINYHGSLNSVRENFDIFKLSGLIRKRGDRKYISNKFNINRSVLCRALDEANILSNYPFLFKQKSKVNPLSRLKTKKERDLFIKKYDVKNLECRRIYKLVKDWRKALEKNPRLLLTEEEHDLILGSLLGDSTLTQRDRNCSFSVGHSKKQEKYLYWKYNILKDFIKVSPYWVKRKFGDRAIEILNLRTFTHPIFNFYYKLFYKKGKKTVTREMLNMLTSRSLSVWICDDGSFDNKQGYIVLCTNSFSLEEHNIMKKYFEEFWKISPTIGFRDKKYYYLRFKQGDSKKLIKIIKPFIIESMKYKISKKNG